VYSTYVQEAQFYKKYSDLCEDILNKKYNMPRGTKKKVGGIGIIPYKL
jgi:hypothetical protein